MPQIEYEMAKFEETYLLESGFSEHIENDLYYTVDKDDNWCALTEKGMKSIEHNRTGLQDLFLIPNYENRLEKIRKSDLNS